MYSVYCSSLKPEYGQKLKMLINFHGPVVPTPRPHPIGLPPVVNQVIFFQYRADTG